MFVTNVIKSMFLALTFSFFISSKVTGLDPLEESQHKNLLNIPQKNCTFISLERRHRIKKIKKKMIENLNLYCVSALSLTIGICGVIRCLRKFTLSDKLSGDQQLNGKIAVITGANTGIGKETAKGLAQRGATVILACRNLEKACATAKELQKLTGNSNIIPMELDLARFDSIRKFAEDIKKYHKKLHILINNAGVFFIPHSLTVDGFETLFQVNYLGHFLLTLLLLELLKDSRPSRIINITSQGHSLCRQIDFEDINGTKEYRKFKAYSQSKLAQLFFTKTLSEKIKGSKVTVNAVNPGNVKTDIYRNFFLISNPILRFIQWPIHWFIFKTPEKGSYTSLYCAVSSELDGITGKYFSDCKETQPSATLLDKEMENKLWEKSLKYVGLTSDYEIAGN